MSDPRSPHRHAATLQSAAPYLAATKVSASAPAPPGPPTPSASPPPALPTDTRLVWGIVVVALGLAFVGAIVAAGAIGFIAGTKTADAPAPTFHEAPGASPAVAVRAPEKPAATVAAPPLASAPDCRLPYTVDQTGMKRWKRECL